MEKEQVPAAAGIRFLTDFWQEKYIEEYIRCGGSKIKFVTGRPGSGKSFFLNQVSAIARQCGYRTADFSAREIWLNDFKDIYFEILRQCDLMECLQGCSYKVIAGMGYDYREIPKELTFVDFLSRENAFDALTRREIRTQLKEIFLDNPLLDNNFALACSMLTGSLLGYPMLEEQNKALLLGWLGGDRSAKLVQLRALGLSPSRITRYNARHMLRSLAEVVHIGGYAGVFVTVDDLDILTSRSSLEPLHYTKMKREDTYESIRQLIDDIDSLRHLMFVFAFDRALMDDENCGLKSYQALWMRIQTEIHGERFNRFADIVDLDAMAAQEYTPKVLAEISESFSRALSSRSVQTLSLEQAEALMKQAGLGNIGIPQLIYNTMTGGADDGLEQ